jgi:beta-lactamase class A
MDRLILKPRLKLDRLDVMLAFSLAVVVASYALGYRLDWSQLDQGSEAQATLTEPARPVFAQRPEPSPAQAPAVAPAALAPAAGPVMVAAPTAAAGRPVLVADPREEQWQVMTRDLARLAARYPGRVAIVVKDLKSKREWDYHSDDLFPSASLIKVPVMICVFQRIRNGELALSDQLTLRRRNRIGGSGSLKWRPDGTKVNVRELIQRMISESDNTATNMLIEAVGMNFLQQQFPKIGLLYTGIYTEGMSIKGGRVTHENYTTAREMAMMLEKIYRGEMIDRAASSLMLDVLKHKKAVASRLAKGLPRNWEIAHKTGLLRQACHDSAIIFSPEGDYVVTVLTGHNPDYKTAKNFISQLGRITFRHYGGIPHYYAKSGRRSLAAR